MNIEIYTDGSCKNNPGFGSFGYIIYINGDFYMSYCESTSYMTTNNIMELNGILYSLEMLYKLNLKYDKCIIFTDSQYAYNGITNWIHTWIKNMWKTSESKPVLNIDLWKKIWNIYRELNNVEISWIRAHTNRTDTHSIRNKLVDYIIR